MRSASLLILVVALVGSTAGQRYGNLPNTVGYALPASLTSVVAATHTGSELSPAPAPASPPSSSSFAAAAMATNSVYAKDNSKTNEISSTTTKLDTSAAPSAIVTEANAPPNGSSTGSSATPAPSTAPPSKPPSVATSSSTSAPPITSTSKPQTEPTEPPKEEEASSAPSTELQPTSSATPLPTTGTPEDNELDLSSQRRVITYDQRQEGQYNIRADLENFMIVLIPPTATEGLSLLDLLTKTAFKRNSLRSKSKRKHGISSGGKYRHALKSSSPSVLPINFQHAGRLSAMPALDAPRGYLTAPAQFAQTPFDTFIGSHSSAAAIPMLAASSPNRINDYIESRATARLDASTNNPEDAASGIHSDRPVDVLPPPYPLAYQHLIKPFHLEAEPTVIQALPPPELNVAPAAHLTGNYLDSYNQLLAPGLTASNSAAAATGDAAAISSSTTTARAISTDSGSSSGGKGATAYFRLSRAIRGDTYFDSNGVSSSPNSLHQSSADLQPLYRAEHSLGATYLYPPIDTPRIYFNTESNTKTFEAPHDAQERSQSMDDADDNGRVGEVYVPPRELKDEIEWEQFFDTMVKEANDSLCMPGQRRDSYGMCRQVEGY